MNRLLVLLGLILGCSSTWATTIYKYTDREGNVTYSNIPVRGAQVITITPSISSTSPKKESAPTHSRNNNNSNTASSGTSSGTAYPVISPATQQKRDKDRTLILINELSNEKTALTKAQQQLIQLERRGRVANQTPEAFQNEIQNLKNLVYEREANIHALQKELKMQR